MDGDFLLITTDFIMGQTKPTFFKQIVSSQNLILNCMPYQLASSLNLQVTPFFVRSTLSQKQCPFLFLLYRSLSLQPSTFGLVAQIVSFNMNKEPWYESCSKCNKILKFSNDGTKCSICHDTSTKSELQSLIFYCFILSSQVTPYQVILDVKYFLLMLLFLEQRFK